MEAAATHSPSSRQGDGVTSVSRRCCWGVACVLPAGSDWVTVQQRMALGEAEIQGAMALIAVIDETVGLIALCRRRQRPWSVVGKQPVMG